MKKIIVLLIVCLFCTTAQAALIDDFADTGLTEYTKSVVNDGDTNRTVSFASPSDVLEVSKSADTSYEQVVFLRAEDLTIGDALRIDTAAPDTTDYVDFGIVVCNTVDPPDVPDGATGDVRAGILAIYMKPLYDSIGWLGRDGNGSDVGSSSGVGITWADLIGLYIQRNSDTEFEGGYTTASGDTSLVTWTVTDTDIGDAVGIWGDVRAVTTYGDLDNLRTGISSIGNAWDPDPENEIDNVGEPNATQGPLQITLKWKTGLDPIDPNNFDPNINNHLVYMDINSAKLHYGGGSVWDDNIPESGPDFNASVTFAGLAYDTTYYWRVNESVNNSGPNETDPDLRIGNIWSFTTIGQSPEFTDQPDDALAAINDTVVFTVGVSSPTTVEYQWYKSADAQIGGDSAIGTDQNSLTVVASVANDAYYYVVVTNDANSVPSDIVHLWLEREIGRWKLNNNLNDSSGLGYNAAWDAVGDPCTTNQKFSTDHIEGTYSVDLQDDPNAFVSVPNSEDYFNSYVVGLTASCWVKTDYSGSYKPIIAKQSRSTMDPDQGWVLEINNGTPFFSVRNAATDLSTGTAIADANWHMVTAVFDVENTDARLYVDGLRVVNNTATQPGGAVKSIDRFAIGSEDANDGSYAGGSFDGLIDDVRIFTYPKTSVEVAAMYVEHVTDAEICIDSTNPEFDLNTDCKVDLADLALLSGNWLDCNLYPLSACSE
ncbi:MAG: LamG domain-containing protein [Sedimentisphaerales bacterium]|nr:LamG domain-containing protein [Sedimentisphaerales bacterium]